MRIHFQIITTIGLILLCYSCSNNENTKEDKQGNSEVIKYTYRPLRTTYPSEIYIKELDSSKWILKSYNIHPSEKWSFNLGTKDSLFFHRASNQQEKDIYVFKPKLGLIYKNERKVGTIFTEKIEFGSHSDLSGNKMGTRYRTILNFCQSEDSIMNGAFNIGFHKNNRLFISQLRLDNETKIEEAIQLIFYKIK